MEHVFQCISPINGEQDVCHEFTSAEELATICQAGSIAAQAWGSSSFQERSALLNRIADKLEEHKEDLAFMISVEMGKVLKESEGEIEKCIWVCRYYAEQGEAFLSDLPILSEAESALLCHKPLGLILAIMPWNFPFWQFFRFAAPAIMAGNAILLKPAPNSPSAAFAVEDLLRHSDSPEHLLQKVFIRTSEVPALIASPQVNGVTFTGSTRAGRIVAGLAGQALKKCVVELGGSDPYLILEDADLDLAVEKCVTSRFLNAGQSCIGAKRILVVDSIYEAFEEKIHARIAALTAGNPLEAESDMGPIARRDLRDQLHRQVQETVEAGAQLLCGGEFPEGSGFYYPPTLLAGVEASMTAGQEELFGPVACLFRAADEAEAIAIANDSVYGLGAAVFTRDVERGERIAKHLLEAGAVAINDFVRSDPRMPFGGIKDSGFGRELGRAGLLEFVNLKSVVRGA